MLFFFESFNRLQIALTRLVQFYPSSSQSRLKRSIPSIRSSCNGDLKQAELLLYMNYLDSQLDLYVHLAFVSLLLLVQILILMWICIISTTKHSSSNKMKTKKQSGSICPYLIPSQYPVLSPGSIRIYFVFVLIFMTCLLLKKICRSLIG